MNKELQELIALVLEIGENTDHYISFHLSTSNIMEVFDVTIYKNGVIGTCTADCIAECQHLTIENIEKCKEELLKYKEA